jgi:hypothetical protein
VDPTPGNAGSRLAGQADVVQQGQDSSWSARWDSLRIMWYRRIVNFDSRQQVQMLEQVKTLTTGSSAALKERMDALAKQFKAWLAKPWDGARVAKLAGAVVGMVAAAVLLLQLGRWGWQRWRRWRQPASYDPVRQAAGRWLGRLRGASEDRGRSAEDRQVVSELQRLRYGRRETWPEPRAVFRRAKQARRAARR